MMEMVVVAAVALSLCSSSSSSSGFVEAFVSSGSSSRIRSIGSSSSFETNGDKNDAAGTGKTEETVMKVTSTTSSSAAAAAQQQPPQPREPDSMEKFAQDIATVLKVLRPEQQDPTIWPLFRNSHFTQTWTLQDWSRQTSRWRYMRWALTFPTSRLLRRVFPQLAVLIIWSAFAVWMSSREVGLLSQVALPLTPLSLVSTFVAALLTLRSNQGLDRFNAGRLAFGQVVLYTRDMAQLIASNIYSRDQQLGLLLLRHLALFGWLLKNFLRGDEVNGTDEDIIRVMLPHPADADYVLRQRKKPVAVVTRVRQVIHHMADQKQLHTAEELALDHTSQALNQCIMTTERIRASPIPPLYTAHTGRLLIFYLVFLPLALKGSGMLNGIGTVITSAAVGYAMMGLDEISHLLEQPFKLMPLYHLSKNSMIDVGDALVCMPPPLPNSVPPTTEKTTEPVYPPIYW